MADQSNPPKKKSCFVIGPIGKEGSDTRKKADLLLALVIKQVLEDKPFQYNVTRSDSLGEPGLISVQVISRVIESDLVVADLSGQNPNAFYELAIRHMEEKPVIHMTDETALPFDVFDYRTIQYDMGDMAGIESAKRELADQALAIESEGYEAANQITKARGSRQLRRSSDPLERLVADLVDEVSRLKASFGRLEASVLASPPLGDLLGIRASGMFTKRRPEDVLADLMEPRPVGINPFTKAFVETLKERATKTASSNDDDEQSG